jgi:hypothetical protein
MFYGIWPAVSGEDLKKKTFLCMFTLLLISPLGEGLSPLFEQI